VIAASSPIIDNQICTTNGVIGKKYEYKNHQAILATIA